MRRPNSLVLVLVLAAGSMGCQQSGRKSCCPPPCGCGCPLHAVPAAGCGLSEPVYSAPGAIPSAPPAPAAPQPYEEAPRAPAVNRAAPPPPPEAARAPQPLLFR